MMPLKSFKKPRSKLATYYKTIYWNLMNTIKTRRAMKTQKSFLYLPY